jgi:hypothetical protein
LLLVLFVGCLLGAPQVAAAQSVSSVVEKMRAQYQNQIETVDTYIVETNMYTSYNRKVSQNGDASYESRTEMKGEGGSSIATGTTPSAAQSLQLDRLKEHATYGGTETINGTTCHILAVDDPSKVNPDMKKSNASEMTYYIDAERYVPARLVMNTKNEGRGGPKTSTVTINMKNYQTVDGLTLPYRMEFQFDMDMSEKQKKQMAMMIEKMENMPEEQSKRMQKMMGNQLDMMKQMLSGEPMVVEVQDVKVNTEIPDGVF